MIQYTMAVSDCYLTIIDSTNTKFDDFKLSNIRINYNANIFVITDYSNNESKKFEIAIANLSSINAGAFASFSALWTYINTARSACLASNNNLNGDVTGTFSNNLVSKIQGKELPTSQPADKNIYMYDFATNKFVWKNIYTDFPNIIFASVTDGTAVTGVITEQISSTNLIEKGTVGVGTIQRYFSQSKYTGTAGTKIKRAWINTTPTLGGALLLGTSTTGVAGKRSDGMDRYLAVKSFTSTEVMAGSSASNTSSANVSSAVSSLNIDWVNSDQYIIETEQLANAGDTATCSFRFLEKISIV